jgi:hypothetical protein
MPRHKRVTTCRLSGGPVSKFCTCEHCTLSVCAVCGAYEGGLTTDCPGAKVSFDRQQEVSETNLDYTDVRGWYQGEPTKRRSPRFEGDQVPQLPPPIDPRAIVAPGIDWAAIDLHESLRQELGLRAFAWVLADRICDDQSARLARVEEEVNEHLSAIMERDELLAQLEREKIDFHLASQRAEARDDEFRQAARKLVEALEASTMAAREPYSKLQAGSCKGPPDRRNPEETGEPAP